MSRKPGRDEGLTVYQLLVSIVVIVIVGSLWMAYNKSQEIKGRQQSTMLEMVNG
jgi:heme/copper-type cytochrome/quinol oxidase subunit 4